MSDEKAFDAKIQLNYISAVSGKIAHIRLNKPKALNALDLDMVNLMLDALDSIAKDDDVSAVLLDSEGDKAFCAGGDIVSMHKAMKDNAHATQVNEVPSTPAFLQEFFTQEYRLDYCLHTFSKPVIVWGNGIIMGGGLGLFAGSHFKIVTETARIAMPEISIGLFPDVGASYFLNKMPNGVGMFLGLTAASINTLDTLEIGLADAFIAHQDKPLFLNKLAQLSHIDAKSLASLSKEINSDTSVLRPSNIAPILSSLSSLHQVHCVSAAEKALEALVSEAPDNTYLQKALKTFHHGSAITANLVLEQLTRSKDMSLADCFRMELSMAFTCSALGEFEEGVRALLIDKDNQPKWQYARPSEVPESVIQAHFSQFEGLVHPLAKLEEDFAA
ncbi:enoyl-CoA hydratase/isomerase family protein [Glaciecola sp. XM2]|uniref:enoyl-CoA hydratase/isomerase family protein n=1 Tax=Glaciecola sp. XM2 TaxID=1914931 RepID=UPI001BDEA8D7|nr:enoyl-CoA hydratase/isomerase family protein [Glaciecola sp. XM2]MBT1451969.1 enoyl-CoA hydratase/isomerase family protein [Glaciecola sp. XM2]